MGDIDLIYNTEHTLNVFVSKVKHNLKDAYNFVIQKYISKDDIKLIIVFFIEYIIVSYFTPTLYNLNLNLLFCLYWILLGVLSTIGLGFGFQTGIFFVVPYILNEYNTTSIEPIEFSKFNVFLNTLPIVVLWGFGSALGEIPPFILAKYNSDKDQILKEVENSYFSKILDLFKYYKFRTILFVSAWPNVAFDMCGLMCGYYNLTLTEFLVPTIIGKSLIKSPAQSVFIIYSYSYYNHYFEQESGILVTLWNSLFIIVLLYFVKITIEKMAKS